MVFEHQRGSSDPRHPSGQTHKVSHARIVRRFPRHDIAAGERHTGIDQRLAIRVDQVSGADPTREKNVRAVIPILDTSRLKLKYDAAL